MFEFFGNAFDLRRPRIKNYLLHGLHRLRLRRFKMGTWTREGGLQARYRVGTHDEVILREVWQQEIYDLKEVDIAEGDVVLDVGAQIGSFSLLAASRGARVLAFEPCPMNAALLRENVRLNGFSDRVDVCEQAVLRPGVAERTLYQTYTNLGGHSLLGWVGPGVRVACTSLDAIFREHGIERCRVLKIDVEGAECPVLYSASSATLARVQLVFAEVIDHPELEQERQPDEPAYDHESLMGFLGAEGFEVSYDAANMIVVGRRP